MKWNGTIRRTVAGCLAAALLCAPAIAAPAWAANTQDLLVTQQRDYDNRFADLENLWCAPAVEICYETGLLEGRQENCFDALSQLTNARILVISARLVCAPGSPGRDYDPYR